MNTTNSRADKWLFAATALYFVMNGAQLWETAIMVPAWTAAPPQSLHFFHGPYGLDFKIFWIVLHSVHEVVLILALIFNWRISYRKAALLILLAIHIGLRVWTLQYFAPVIIEFQSMHASQEIDPKLVGKASAWKNLNYVRVSLFFMVNLGFVYLLSLNSNKNANARPIEANTA